VDERLKIGSAVVPVQRALGGEHVVQLLGADDVAHAAAVHLDVGLVVVPGNEFATEVIDAGAVLGVGAVGILPRTVASALAEVVEGHADDGRVGVFDPGPSIT
jgi:hypothetical protein